MEKPIPTCNCGGLYSAEDGIPCPVHDTDGVFGSGRGETKPTASPKSSPSSILTFPFTRPEFLITMGYREAYEALPEPYRNDSVLTFYLEGETLCAKGDKVLGEDVWEWCHNCWASKLL